MSDSSFQGRGVGSFSTSVGIRSGSVYPKDPVSGVGPQGRGQEELRCTWRHDTDRPWYRPREVSSRGCYVGNAKWPRPAPRGSPK